MSVRIIGWQENIVVYDNKVDVSGIRCSFPKQLKLLAGWQKAKVMGSSYSDNNHFQTGMTAILLSRLVSSSYVTIVPEVMDNAFMMVCNPRNSR